MIYQIRSQFVRLYHDRGFPKRWVRLSGCFQPPRSRSQVARAYHGSSGRPNYPRPRCTSYMELVGESLPSSTNLQEHWSSFETQKGLPLLVVTDLANPAQLKIADALYDQLLGIHISTLVVAIDPSVTPTNQYLIDSLLSAISIKYGLCDTHSGAVAHGLNHNPKHYRQVLCSWSMPSTPYGAGRICMAQRVPRSTQMMFSKLLRRSKISHRERCQRTTTAWGLWLIRLYPSLHDSST